MLADTRQTCSAERSSYAAAPYRVGRGRQTCST